MFTKFENVLTTQDLVMDNKSRTKVKIEQNVTTINNRWGLRRYENNTKKGSSKDS